MKMQISTLPKFGISIFGKLGFEKNEKSGHQNLKFVWILGMEIYPKNWKICTSKPQIRFRFWILGQEIWFSKFENRFLRFLSNLNSRPSNLKSATSKTPKSWFSHTNSYFRSKFVFDQNLDFVLGWSNSLINLAASNSPLRKPWGGYAPKHPPKITARWRRKSDWSRKNLLRTLRRKKVTSFFTTL